MTKSLELDPKGKIKVRHFRRRNRLKDEAGSGQSREPGKFAVAVSLYIFTGARSSVRDSHVEIVKSHIDTINVVIKKRGEGDGAFWALSSLQPWKKRSRNSPNRTASVRLALA
jgi:hypothetical protein